MTQTKPVLLMAFAANDLPEVLQEADQTWQFVEKHPSIESIKLENPDINELGDAVIDHQHNLLFFHFSGHSNKGALILDEYYNLPKYNLARLLTNGKDRSLQLALLNGCESSGHVGILTARGVKAVIATNNKVNSKQAAQLARFFYKCFFQRNFTLKDAFEKATATLPIELTHPVIINPGEINEDAPIKGDWTLYVQNDHKEVLDWTLDDFIKECSGTPTTPKPVPEFDETHSFKVQSPKFHVPEELRKKITEEFIYQSEEYDEMYKVNCDRINEVKRMQEHFKSKKTDHKFYLIQSCQTQSPQDLVQRFLLSAQEANASQSWHYQKQAAKSRFIKVININITDYDTLIEKELSSLMKTGMAKSDTQLDQIQEEKIQYNYLVTCFQLDLHELEQINDLKSILDHWLNGFNQFTSNGFKYISFFIIKAEGIHKKMEISNTKPMYVKKVEDATQQAYRLKSKHKGRLIVIEKLEQVEPRHLKVWLGDILSLNTAKDYSGLIQLWCQIKDESFFDDDTPCLYDMSFCSTLMQAIWHCSPTPNPISSR